MVPLHLLAPFLEPIEGNILQSYDDKTGRILNEGDIAIGKVTIGKGITAWENGAPIAPGSTITFQESMDLFSNYVRNVLNPSVKRLLKPEVLASLTDEQKTAFGSFVFNLGEDKCRGYTLIRLINEGTSDENLARWWVKYHYQGDDPVEGLYKRRIAEVLLWFGLDWRVWHSLSWADDVIDVMTRMGWKAQAPEPATYKGFADPTPEDGKITTQDLNTIQLAIMQGATPGDKPLSVNTKLPEQVPYGIHDPREVGLKPMEESARYKGAVQESKGKEFTYVGGSLAGVAGMAGSAKEITGFFDSFDFSTILLAAFGVSAILICIGVWRWIDGQNRRYKAEKDAQQGLY